MTSPGGWVETHLTPFRHLGRRGAIGRRVPHAAALNTNPTWWVKTHLTGDALTALRNVGQHLLAQAPGGQTA